MDFLVQLEQTGFGTWVREANSLLAYPGVLFLHTIGLGFLVGISVFVALRLLGFAESVPLASVRKFCPMMWAGFWVNAASGIALFVADATTKAANPVFYVKLGFIAAGVVVMRSISTRILRNPLLEEKPLQMNAKILAAASIVCWMGAIIAGRLLAYIGPGIVTAQGGN